MKSMKKLFFLILLFISLTVSCQREESLDIRNTEYISFKFSDENLSASGTVTKGTCDTLSYEIGDWDYIGEESDSDVQTKGSLTEYLSGKVGMFAQWSGSSALEMDNALHTVSSRELVPETKLLWKNYTSGTIKFLSYAPYNEDIKAGNDASGKYFTYTVAGTISEQQDLLLATASHECSMNKRNAIPLAYRHGLTAIQFRMGFDCNVKKITISNVKNNGKFYLDGTTPSVYSGSATYSLTYDGGIYVRSTTKDVNVDIISGEVQYNASDINGGGLCVDMSGSSHQATITIGKSGGVAASPNISSNSASMSGGGMAVEGSGSNIIIKSGTVKGNVSAYVKNEDIRNDGGMVDLQGKGAEVDVNYKTITFYANNGYDPEPYAEQRVVTSTNSPLNPPAAARAFEKEFYHKASWNTRRDGSGENYNIDGTAANMNITDDLSLYAQWVENK